MAKIMLRAGASVVDHLTLVRDESPASPTAVIGVDGWTNADGNAFNLPDRPGGTLVLLNLDNQITRVDETAAIAASNCYVAPPAGMYRISVYHTSKVALAAGTLATTIRWTDENGAKSSKPAPDVLLTGTNFDQGAVVARVASGNITYETSLTGVVGSPVYSIYVRVENI